MRADVLKAVTYESSEMCGRVVWYIVVSVSEESVALIFSPEDGCIRSSETLVTTWSHTKNMLT
jgi:hypothetical protein